MNKIVATLSAAAALAVPVSAIPLQLDIAGGTYDDVTGTVMAQSNPFTLYTLINEADGGLSGVNTRYVISAAIMPKTTVALTEDFGSFTIDGTVYSAANMAYGIPPVERPDFRPRDLSDHSPGIFDTHYAEIQIPQGALDLSKRALEYDVRINPGGLTPDASGPLLFEDFLVDIRGLTDGYAVHFDFFAISETTNSNGEPGTKITMVASFNKDAQSPTRPVPDGGTTALLLGGAFLGLAAFRRRA